MIPELRIRTFTDDQYYLDKVFYDNSYRLKDLSGKKVVDIGAHVGYFTFAALVLNAEKVWSLEPFLENYKQLLKNVGFFGSSVMPYCVGAYTEKAFINFAYPKKTPNINFLKFGQVEIENTDEDFSSCYCVTLDEILSKYVNASVDILKINIGYAEVDLLLQSSLSNVNTVIGETEVLDSSKRDMFYNKMIDRGFSNYYTKLNEDQNSTRMGFWFSKDKTESIFWD